MIQILDELPFSQFIELLLPTHFNYACEELMDVLMKKLRIKGKEKKSVVS
jgi:hypothetical protein